MEFIIQLGATITALGIIAGIGKKWLSGQFEPINKKIDTIDTNQSRNYLVDFMADIESGIKKNDNQIQRAYELYDHYINELGKNSYIHDKWEKLKREGMI